MIGSDQEKTFIESIRIQYFSKRPSFNFGFSNQHFRGLSFSRWHGNQRRSELGSISNFDSPYIYISVYARQLNLHAYVKNNALTLFVQWSAYPTLRSCAAKPAKVSRSMSEDDRHTIARTTHTKFILLAFYFLSTIISHDKA